LAFPSIQNHPALDGLQLCEILVELPCLGGMNPAVRHLLSILYYKIAEASKKLGLRKAQHAPEGLEDVLFWGLCYRMIPDRTATIGNSNSNSNSSNNDSNKNNNNDTNDNDDDEDGDDDDHHHHNNNNKKNKNKNKKNKNNTKNLVTKKNKKQEQEQG
jgi:hypothetical protein